jgi:hypothetical protein
VADTFKAQSTFVGEEKSHPSKVIRLSNRAKKRAGALINGMLIKINKFH